MIEVLKAENRGKTQKDWLTSFHSFSFGEYQNPNYKNFCHMRVINDDLVEPKGGFPTHSHRDMEIITYIIDGALEHKDSMGNHSVIKQSEVQVMQAGFGVTHSEFNPSITDKVRLLQIWVYPIHNSLTPSYQQKCFESASKLNRLCPIVNFNGENGALKIDQHSEIFACILEENKEISYLIKPNHSVWVQVIKGEITLNGERYLPGDGIAIKDEEFIKIASINNSEFLLFDFV